MKDRYLVKSAGIVLSLLCLTSCATHESSTDKSQSKSEATVSEKNANKNNTVEDTTISKTGKNAGGDVASSVAPGAEKAPLSEGLPNDKIIAELTKKLSKSKLDKLSDSLVICTVNNVPLTIGDYRRQFKSEQQQLQASLTLNPEIANHLMQMAQEKGVSLSLDERKHLINSATKMQAGGKKGFDKMLAENNMTKAQFQDQVMSVGLAFKTANVLIEEGLVKELVNRWLLAQAAKENGFSKAAMNKYTEVAGSAQYKKLLAVSGISADDLQNEIIANELCLKEIEKIKKESPLSDLDISNFYEKNRGKFRHNGRIRISQIFIARGAGVTESPQEQRARVKRENPGVSEADISKNIAESEKKKEQLAQSILERARKGEDFAALANQYSEDMIKPEQKNGGDVGFQETSKLEKSFAAKISKIPAGGIIPEVIVSPLGFHIFKVTEKESPGFYKLGEIKDNLKKMLAEEKGQQVLDDWLTTAREKAVIAVSPEMKDLIAANKLPKRVQ